MTKADFYRNARVVSVEWWMMDYDEYPNLFWGRLKLFNNGTVEVAFQDKTSYGFADMESAQNFLWEDEFRRLNDLDANDKKEMVIPLDVDVKPNFLAEDTFEHFKFIGKY